jgi:virulence-associated protein VagC
MTTYKIAHIHEQGQDLIIVPLDQRFDHTNDEQKAEFAAHLQRCATSAGLKGHVVLV